MNVAGLNDEGQIDIDGNHLELTFGARLSPPQKRRARQHLKDARMGTGVVIPDTHPITNARLIDRRCAGVDGFARQLGRHFALGIPDGVLIAINSSHPGDGLAVTTISVRR